MRYLIPAALLLAACSGSKHDALEDNASQPVVNQTIPEAPPTNATAS